MQFAECTQPTWKMCFSKNNTTSRKKSKSQTNWRLRPVCILNAEPVGSQRQERRIFCKNNNVFIAKILKNALTTTSIYIKSPLLVTVTLTQILILVLYQLTTCMGFFSGSPNKSGWSFINKIPWRPKDLHESFGRRIYGGSLKQNPKIPKTQ